MTPMEYLGLATFGLILALICWLADKLPPPPPPTFGARP
jgi:hypothetical protein